MDELLAKVRQWAVEDATLILGENENVSAQAEWDCYDDCNLECAGINTRALSDYDRWMMFFAYIEQYDATMRQG